MKGSKPVRDTDEMFRRINRESADAGWTGEELRDSLRAGGVDPEQLVCNVRARVEHLIRRSEGTAARVPEEVDKTALLPLLREIRKRTGLMAPDIAVGMGVPLAFLSAVERYPQAVPSSWRAELAVRAERGLRISRDVVIASLEAPRWLGLAALSDASSADDAMSYEGILEQSGMDDDARRYWLSLAVGG